MSQDNSILKTVASKFRFDRMWQGHIREALRAIWQEQRCTLCCTPMHTQSATYTRPVAPEIKDVAGVPGAIAVPGIARANSLGICQHCLELLLPKTTGFCERCGEFFASAEITGICQSCLSNPPVWDNFFFYAPYQGYMRDLLQKVKFQSGLCEAAALGRLLATHPKLANKLMAYTMLSANLPAPAAGAAALPHSTLSSSNLITYDAVVPMPLHKSRLRERGFNQAYLIACAVAKGSGLAVSAGYLQRIKPNRMQSGLGKRERQKNVQGIFRADPKVRGKHLLLLDDICTTGATLRAAASILRKAGASGVDVAVVARTPGKTAIF